MSQIYEKKKSYILVIFIFFGKEPHHFSLQGWRNLITPLMLLFAVCNAHNYHYIKSVLTL